MRVFYCVCVLQLWITLPTVQKVTSFPHICILTMHTENYLILHVCIYTVHTEDDLISPHMHPYIAYRRWPHFFMYASLQCIEKMISSLHVCIITVHTTSFFYAYNITEHTDDLISPCMHAYIAYRRWPISPCMHAYSAHRRWPHFFTHASLQWILKMT